jgi:hypothetical protein
VGRLADEVEALGTMEDVLASLRNDESRDEVLQRLIDAIEDDRASILADVMRRRLT